MLGDEARMADAPDRAAVLAAAVGREAAKTVVCLERIAAVADKAEHAPE